MQDSAKPPIFTPAEDFARLRDYLDQRIVGQPGLNLRLLVALLANGHLLVEGAPGLAKTTAVKTLAAGLEGDFHRVQFTPDLLPADLTGTDIYRPQEGSFLFQPGPIFHNFVLADEVNRRSREGAVGSAGGDGRGPGHHWAYQLPVTQAFSGDGDPKPYRTGRHLPTT